MDKLYRVVIIDDDEFSADNLCLELKKYNRLSIDGMARNGANGRKLLEKVHPDLLFQTTLKNHINNYTFFLSLIHI